MSSPEATHENPSIYDAVDYIFAGRPYIPIHTRFFKTYAKSRRQVSFTQPVTGKRWRIRDELLVGDIELKGDGSIDSSRDIQVSRLVPGRKYPLYGVSLLGGEPSKFVCGREEELALDANGLSQEELFNGIVYLASSGDVELDFTDEETQAG